MSENLLDCLVVGAGPAGLTAATYLARFRRHILLADAGASRARWIPASHNCPGFPFGVAGNELLARFRLQADAYGVAQVRTRITQLSRRKGFFFSSRRRHTRWTGNWSSDVCSSDLRGVEDGKAYRAGLNNTTTARDLGVLLAAIANEKAASPASCREMLAILGRQQFKEEIGRASCRERV